jgi:glycosyltransferase involved in cell wall biosynthesis
MKRLFNVPKVAVLFYHIGPYHSARLNAASTVVNTVGVEWSVCDAFRLGRAGGKTRYELVSLFDDVVPVSDDRARLRSRVSQALDVIRPDVVAINGWGDFGAAIAMACCVQKQLPLIVMSESTAGDEDRHWWKELFKTRVVRLCSAGLVGGEPHMNYLAALGLPRDSIFLGYDAVDNEYFAQGARAARADGDGIRRRLGLPRDYFLASSRFVPKKNLAFLLRAFARYRTQCTTAPWDLVLLGDGPLRAAIESLVTSLGLERSVHLPGFKHYDELPGYYGLAGGFIHASTTEQWGLVVNEAMASGLPIMVSDRCGCATDLVVHGENGFQFDPTDEATLVKYMVEITRDDERRAAMGRASGERIRDWGPERFARGLQEAAECALRSGPPPRRWFDGLMLKVLAAR